MGDLAESVAEELHMIHAHIRDHADERAEDVGAVEPTAHTHLHHGYVHLLIHKVAEGERRGQLKERRLQVVPQVAEKLLHKSGDILLRDHLPIDPNPLPVGDDMG